MWQVRGGSSAAAIVGIAGCVAVFGCCGAGTARGRGRSRSVSGRLAVRVGSG